MRSAALTRQLFVRRIAVIWFLCLVAFFTGGVAVATTVAQPAEDLTIDAHLWRNLQTTPTHTTTFIVTMQSSSEDDSWTAIDAQVALADLLEELKIHGVIEEFTPRYGENMVIVTGSLNAMLFLSELPGVASIDRYDLESASPDAYQELVVEATGQITGKVTGADGVTPLEGITITAYFQVGPTSWPVAGTASSDVNGNYAISGLETGIYRVRFRDPGANYVQQYYNDKLTFEKANGFIVIDGQTTSSINASLDIAGHITGKITGQGGGDVKDVVVSALRLDGGSWQIFASDLTDNKGQYDVGGLISDTYRLQFADIFRRYVTEYYDNVGDVDSADDIMVQTGQSVANINAELGPYGSLAGTVTGVTSQQGLESVEVNVFEYNNSLGFWDFAGTAETGSDGNYLINGLLTKNYRVEFIDTLGFFSTEYYDDQPDIDSASDVPVTLGLETGNIDSVLAPPASTVTMTQVTGWNLISYPIQVADPEISAALSSITGTYEIVWAHDVCDPLADQWKRYDPDVNPIFNTLHEVRLVNGLWLQMRSPENLVISGWENEQVTLELCAGWNLIGYPSLSNRPVAQALASISGKYEVIYQYVASDTGDEWKKYDPDLPFGNTLTEMQAGFGYWIEMKQDAALIITNR